MSLVRQAGCVVIGGRGVLIEGAPGTGKSTLALALIDRGAALLADDGVQLMREGAALIARPHPRTAGLIEVRNLGLVTLPHCTAAPVALLLCLDPQAPRFIEEPETVTIEGIALPRLRLFPDGAVLAIKAELALQCFGLPGPETGGPSA